ncbi:uncharacterized protein F5891DRAFT_706372 [Suillus fuscotomentosus]|uniref:Uncharacterized protein n=1 Tax=Suillus fuscotomentosus TaxID=1912939 RepID=A0AAD4DXK9_9AGAM|nr:uncharacterized protein F5891DRAFT_706372 [Suillus fuscotomentosus]KAG1894724.1 hypothetical protein F5891DRAFT_706372 [Suillus fuscotomentosus]
MKVGGGAMFIDKAYQLVSAQGGSGTDDLEFLLAEMENRVGSLIFILAGYSGQNEKFYVNSSSGRVATNDLRSALFSSLIPLHSLDGPVSARVYLR